MKIDDIRYTKVCYIQDIAKVYRLNTGKLINTDEFDTLYDANIQQLSHILNNLEVATKVEAMFNPYV